MYKEYGMVNWNQPGKSLSENGRSIKENKANNLVSTQSPLLMHDKYILSVI